MLIQVPVSVGELLDKITILKIKEQKIASGPRILNVKAELARLLKVCEDSGIAPSGADFEELLKVNAELWDVEDRIRERELAQDFGPEFIALARAVYRMNDRRFEVKRKLNELWQSEIVEVKSYSQYQ